MEVCLAHSSSSGNRKNLVSNGGVAKANAFPSPASPFPVPSLLHAATTSRPPTGGLAPLLCLRLVEIQSTAADRRDAVLLARCSMAVPPLRLRSTELQSMATELQSTPPLHDLAVGRSNRRHYHTIWPRGALPAGPLLRGCSHRPWT
jgi:hypothetical protein